MLALPEARDAWHFAVTVFDKKDPRYAIGTPVLVHCWNALGTIVDHSDNSCQISFYGDNAPTGIRRLPTEWFSPDGFDVLTAPEPVWSWTPPTDLSPGWYQIAHVKSRDTWLIRIHQSVRSGLWVRIPGGGTESNLAKLPWLWGPRIEFAKVPVGSSEPSDRRRAVEAQREAARD